VSIIRLYLDEDAMDSDLLYALQLRDVDVITVAGTGMFSRSDEEQLQWAFVNNRVVYSFNIRDFYRLHTTLLERGESHAGIILGQQDYSIGEQMRRLLRLITVKSAEDMRNQVEFLSAWGEE
jgi:aerobic-type carbon monoxide dehydrogenase small subunit (CoxS/CutS family)